MCFVRSTSLTASLLPTNAGGKYLGIIKANKGRMAGIQAQTIPTLASTADIVA
jgi:hypothetical protein